MSANALFVVAFVVRKFLGESHYAFLTVQTCALVLLELGLQCTVRLSISPDSPCYNYLTRIFFGGMI